MPNTPKSTNHGVGLAGPALQLHPPLLSDDGGATHCPLALQTLGDQQSATDVHVVLQPFLHTYGAQFCDGPLGGCEV